MVSYLLRFLIQYMERLSRRFNSKESEESSNCVVDKQPYLTAKPNFQKKKELYSTKINKYDTNCCSFSSSAGVPEVIKQRNRVPQTVLCDCEQGQLVPVWLFSSCDQIFGCAYASLKAIRTEDLYIKPGLKLHSCSMTETISAKDGQIDRHLHDIFAVLRD